MIDFTLEKDGIYKNARGDTVILTNEEAFDVYPFTYKGGPYGNVYLKANGTYCNLGHSQSGWEEYLLVERLDSINSPIKTETVTTVKKTIQSIEFDNGLKVIGGNESYINFRVTPGQKSLKEIKEIRATLTELIEFIEENN